MEDSTDIHKYSNKLASIEKSIQSDRLVSAANRKKIAEFTERCKADGMKPASITKDLFSLRFIGRNIKKNFRDANKKDIIRVKSSIEAQNWTDKTKHNHGVALKKFYKWLYGLEEKGQYPKVVSWVETTEKKSRDRLPEEFVNEDELERMMQAADNQRDKAFTLLLFETGARIGEMLNVKIKHIVFEESIGLIMLNGKTGMRRCTIVASVPILAQFIDVHPLKNDPDSFLFLTKHNRMNGSKGYVQLTYAGANKVLKALAERAGIKKRIHPHLFRHSSATRAAKFLTEAQMKAYYGWTRGSDMPGLYTHLSQRDVQDSILKMNGIDTGVKHQVKATIMVCRACKNRNSPGSKFCNVCGTILTLEHAMTVNTLLQSVLSKAPELATKSHEEIFQAHKKKF